MQAGAPPITVVITLAAVGPAGRGASAETSAKFNGKSSDGRKKVSLHGS